MELAELLLLWWLQSEVAKAICVGLQVYNV